MESRIESIVQSLLCMLDCADRNLLGIVADRLRSQLKRIRSIKRNMPVLSKGMPLPHRRLLTGVTVKRMLAEFYEFSVTADYAKIPNISAINEWADIVEESFQTFIDGDADGDGYAA